MRPLNILIYILTEIPAIYLQILIKFTNIAYTLHLGIFDIKSLSTSDILKAFPMHRLFKHSAFNSAKGF